MGSGRILLVEDEAVTALELRADLTARGHEVVAVVARGEDAIRVAGELHPDLILMDIALAGPMSGVDAAAEIRKHLAVPIVFLTAHTDAETVGRAKQVEPFGYISKPINPDTLGSTIEVALYKAGLDAERQVLGQERERLIVELRGSLAKVKLLSGFIPICASCKKVRDDAGYWQQVEVYVRDHSEAEFTHGICPACAKTYFENA